MRRFLKQMGIEKPLLQIAMYEMDKHADKTAYFGYFKSIEAGKNICLALNPLLKCKP